MGWKSFAMVAERAPGETDWSITFPQFPGVTSVAEERGQIFSQACDALASAVDDLAEAGEAIPPVPGDGSLAQGPGTAPDGAEEWFFALVPVEMPDPRRVS